jgi:hypothetical protein
MRGGMEAPPTWAGEMRIRLGFRVSGFIFDEDCFMNLASNCFF